MATVGDSDDCATTLTRVKQNWHTATIRYYPIITDITTRYEPTEISFIKSLDFTTARTDYFLTAELK